MLPLGVRVRKAYNSKTVKFVPRINQEIPEITIQPTFRITSKSLLNNLNSMEKIFLPVLPLVADADLREAFVSPSPKEKAK